MNSTTGEIQFIRLGARVRKDDRGMAFFPFQGGETPGLAEKLLESFHLVSIAPGQERGRHRHPNQTEWLYLFSGAGWFIWQDRDGHRREHRLEGDTTLVVIPPGLPHLLRNDGPGTIFLLAWRLAAPGAPEAPDSVPWPDR